VILVILVMNTALQSFLETTRQNRNGNQRGIFSVCSANRTVLEASLCQAGADGSLLVLEATSNQVNQFGGYTGFKPADFHAFVAELAQQAGYPVDRILLGGDHLGPNPWKHLPAETAMMHAKELIHAYVRAGFKKIHIDTSMPCIDDPVSPSHALSDEIVASRSAELCRIAEETWKSSHNAAPDLVYCIGTEVPIPGGAQGPDDVITPTAPNRARATIDIAREAFLRAGLEDAWSRVVGVVVQPGVEFGDDQIHVYDPAAAAELSQTILNYPDLVYEAHSTDYQPEDALHALVKDHFAILKVGPWLTFAYREALYALESIEKELITGPDKLSQLRMTLDKKMVQQPRHWSSYYSGNETEKQQKRSFSFSDRIRYYWPDEEVQQAVTRLIQNLRPVKVPRSLLSQYLPGQFSLYQPDRTGSHPLEWVRDHIQNVLKVYAGACGYGQA
jgi:D-tagatose-1,6-bisphosphate aldolase subunit GatZ/KbaZ